MRAVFLDRDGVLIKAGKQSGLPTSAKKLSDVVLDPNAIDSIMTLKQLGFLCVMVTNQPDVARGFCNEKDVIEINDYLLKTLNLDATYTCFHDSSDNCDCRKPKPGMILEAAKNFPINLTSSYLVGDRWRDINAGAAAQCCTIFIDHGYKESLGVAPHSIVSNLKEAIDWIVRNEKLSTL
jgi:D-glycero-D-manno-heptose 1,7-bisphosphate phosphatase